MKPQPWGVIFKSVSTVDRKMLTYGVYRLILILIDADSNVPKTARVWNYYMKFFFKREDLC